jgi:hypothetical protein
MSLIDDIKRDIENGTPGPWHWHMGDIQITDPGGDDHVICGMGKSWGARSSEYYRINPGKPQGQANARRIARVPDMEAALLAAADALRRIEASTDTKKQGAIAMAALAAMEARDA